MMYWKVLTTRYAQFSGRAGRREFWLFQLVHFIISAVLWAIDFMVFFGGSIDRVLDEPFALFPISSIYGLLVLIPVLALGVRRLHDIGRTGWWLLIGFVPIIGFVVLLVFAIRQSDDGDNAYGPPGEAPV